MLTRCCWIAKFVQTLCNQHANFVQSLCQLCAKCVPTKTHTYKNTAFWTSRVALIAKKACLLYKYHKISFCTTVHKTTSVYITSSLYKFTQNQFTLQVYTKPIYCTSLHKTSSLYQFTQNQFTIQITQNHFTVQVYTKPVYCTSVHKTSLLYKCNWPIKKGMYMDRQY